MIRKCSAFSFSKTRLFITIICPIISLLFYDISRSENVWHSFTLNTCDTVLAFAVLSHRYSVMNHPCQSQNNIQDNNDDKKKVDNDNNSDESSSNDLVPTDPSDFDEIIRNKWIKLLDRFEKEGIKVDLDNKIIEVKGAIIRDKESPQYPLEYVVVSEGGYTHEALILLKVTPSILNAACIAIGLKPGKTIRFQKKVPPPPKKDVESGKVKPYIVLPPEGQRVYLYVKYDGWKDRPVRFLEDMMVNLRTGRSMKRMGWIYVGSRFAKIIQGTKKVYRYMADMERNIVACYLTGFGNALFDINSTEAINDELFDLNPRDAPPLGARITFIISLKPL